MRRTATVLIFALLAIALPLAGAYLAGHPVESYLQFPARARPARASFDWTAFLIYALIILAAVGPFVWRISTVRRARVEVRPHRFPWWGRAGFGVLVIAWVIAWSRFPRFEAFQPYTFTPLWLGYILVINGLVVRRTGRCLLLSRPACFAALFLASAVFWWYFEYLNRYVGNWYYVGLEFIGPTEYMVHATISFSTVLPAVISTRDWLASFPRLQAGFVHLWPVRRADSKALSAELLILGVLGFLGLGVWPQHLYSMVWLAPLFVLISLQALAGLPNLLPGLKRGDWRGVGLPALAALVAGFFWEMWNYYSFAHWEYSIPLVHRFLLFEMPVLGYAGYLPFGIVCVALGDLVCGSTEKQGG